MVTQSVIRSLEVFEKVAEMQPVRLTELSSRISLPKSTIQRILQTLAEAAWIVTVDNGSPPRWRVAPQIQSLLAGNVIAPDLRSAAHASMSHLHDETGFAVQLAVPSNAEQIVILDKIESVDSAILTGRVGTAAKKFTTSAGIAMLARSANEVLRDLMASIPDVDQGAVMALVEETRLRGYCLRVHEPTGSVYISAPIVDPSGGIAGSLTLGIPAGTTHWHPDKLGQMTVAAASETAGALARSHGV